MYERFTDRAKKIMSLSVDIARQRGQGAIAAEHVFLGLLEEGTGVAAKVLEGSSLVLDTLKRDVERLSPTAPSSSEARVLALDEEAQEVLALSMQESGLLGADYIGSEHLLLGLLRKKECLPARVLGEAGLRLPELRAEVAEFIGPQVEQDEQADAPAFTGMTPTQVGAFMRAFAADVAVPARKEAVGLGHDTIGTGHMLLGLLQSDDATARVLRDRGVSLDAVRERTAAASPPAAAAAGPNMGFSPGAKRAMELAFAAALERGQDRMGSEHVLWAMLQARHDPVETDGPERIALGILEGLGVDIDALQSHMADMLERFDPGAQGS